MTDQVKAREFFGLDSPVRSSTATGNAIAFWSDRNNAIQEKEWGWKGDLIHVIEKSAYDAVVRERDELRDRIEQLECLLGECEKSLEVILYNNHASTLKFSDVAYKTLWKLQKLEAVKEGK